MKVPRGERKTKVKCPSCGCHCQQKNLDNHLKRCTGKRRK